MRYVQGIPSIGTHFRFHIKIVKEINISCTPVHGFEEKSKFHVPGYMDLKKKQNIMYPGTWI